MPESKKTEGSHPLPKPAAAGAKSPAEVKPPAVTFDSKTKPPAADVKSAAAKPAAAKPAAAKPPAPLDPYGALVGAAFGDAFGMATKNCAKSVVAQRFPQGVTFPNKISISPFSANGWSDNIDQMVIVLRRLRDARDAKKAPDAAAVVRLTMQALGDWKAGGFKNRNGDGTPPPTFPGSRTWIAVEGKNSDKPMDSSSVARVLSCPFVSIKDTTAMGRALLFNGITHSDPRSFAYAATICQLIGLSAAGELTSAAVADALEGASKSARLSDGQRKEVWKTASETHSLAKIGLDDSAMRDNMAKAFACAMWAARNVIHASRPGATPVDFVAMLRQVAEYGGDSTTNCAVVGAVVGAHLGFKKLPHAQIAVLAELAWLMNEIHESTGAPIPAMSASNTATPVSVPVPVPVPAAAPVLPPAGPPDAAPPVTVAPAPVVAAPAPVAAGAPVTGGEPDSGAAGKPDKKISKYAPPQVVMSAPRDEAAAAAVPPDAAAAVSPDPAEDAAASAADEFVDPDEPAGADAGAGPPDQGADESLPDVEIDAILGQIG